MSVSLRLSRGGSKKRPYYKVVVANSRAPRDGAYLEQVGTYNPLLAKDDANRVRLVEDRVRYWLGVGAQPTDRVARLLDKAGIKERAATSNLKKGEPGQKAKDRAEEKAEKAREAAEAAEAAAAELLLRLPSRKLRLRKRPLPRLLPKSRPRPDLVGQARYAGRRDRCARSDGRSPSQAVRRRRGGAQALPRLQRFQPDAGKAAR
jgi:small subunit ribosomal protein S16